MKQRRLHKAFLRYHDAENWPLLREALKEMGREDLIGNSKRHLIPTYQPQGTGKSGGEGARKGRKNGKQKFLTKGDYQERNKGNNKTNNGSKNQQRNNRNKQAAKNKRRKSRV